MKLAIFGATGGTGRQLVEQALADGHQVTAFVRRPVALKGGMTGYESLRETCVMQLRSSRLLRDKMRC
jgi:uncharacterized protein YbjT (DUF2867 family)